MPEPKEILEYKTDHDLLIELRIDVRNLSKAIDKLNDGVSARQDKAEKRVDELAQAVSSLQTTRAIAYAYAGLVTLVLIPIVAAYIQAGRL